MTPKEGYQKLLEGITAHLEKTTGQTPSLFVVTAHAEAFIAEIEAARRRGDTVGFGQVEPESGRFFIESPDGLLPGLVDYGVLPPAHSTVTVLQIGEDGNGLQKSSFTLGSDTPEA